MLGNTQKLFPFIDFVQNIVEGFIQSVYLELERGEMKILKKLGDIFMWKGESPTVLLMVSLKVLELHL